MKKLTWLIVLVALLMVGCEDDNTSNVPEESESNTVEAIEPTVEVDLKLDEVEEVPEESVEEEVQVFDGIYSPLTGLEVTEESLLQRPVAVMLDNHHAARFQSGLSDADVVYEVLAEGLITRYLAIFQSKVPQVIGPVRSARPYYIQLALSYNPLYVHVGGSDQAFIDIKRLQMADIDGMRAGSDVYYRTDHKFIPHNMYTSFEGISIEQKRRGYLDEVTYEGMSIGPEVQTLEGEPASYLKVIYKPSSSYDPMGYFIEFKYDQASKTYKRYVNGEAQKDETTEIHLQADNVLVLKAGHEILDNEGRRAVGVVGEGVGYYLNQGVSVPITWTKAGGTLATKYYYVTGDPLVLNPGKTWVQIIPTTTDPLIN